MAMFATMMAAEENAAERRNALSAAKVQIGRSGKFVGQQAIQLHGGIGMTMEYKVGHYFKRVTMIDMMFGDADHHLRELGPSRRVAGRMIGPGAAGERPGRVADDPDLPRLRHPLSRRRTGILGSAGRTVRCANCGHVGTSLRPPPRRTADPSVAVPGDRFPPRSRGRRAKRPRRRPRLEVPSRLQRRLRRETVGGGIPGLMASLWC